MNAKQIDKNISDAVHRFIALIENRYDLVEVIVFGSYARGMQYCDSDVDVAIVLDGEYDFFNTLMDMSDITFDVMLETNVFIDPMPIRLDEWEHPEIFSNPDLLHNIDRDGIRI